MFGKRGKVARATRPGDLAIIGVGATVFVLALAALVAVGLASLLFGRGWVWPYGVGGAASALGGLLTGHPGHGLHPADARRLPGTATLWVVVVVVELAALAAAIAFVRWATATVRAASGATKSEAVGALGERHRLIRRVRSRLRPDDEPKTWPLGRSRRPRGVDLHVPFASSVGVLGRPDITLQPALAAPRGLLHVTPRPDDVLLTLSRRERDGRPVAVFDPRGLLPGLPSLAWDPLHGCVEAAVATRRAKAFTAATVPGADGDEAAARANAARAATILQCYLHAAALTGRTVGHVMEWVADPAAGNDAETILTEHPHAEPHWAALLHGTSPEAVPTLQRSMDAFLHSDIAKRCLPGWRRPATDIADVFARGGTIYVLGNDDPYATVSPLLTAVADDVLAAAPPAVVLDVGIAPVPALRPRIDDGLVWTVPEQRQLVTCYGDAEAGAIVTSTEVMVHADEGADEATVVAPPCPPILARLRPVPDELLAERDQARQRAAASEPPWYAQRDPARAALTAAHEHGLHVDTWQKGVST